jgi:hypothetical protein
MATSITNPGQGLGGGLGAGSNLNSIDQAFGSIYNMFGPTGSGGGAAGTFGVTPQPVSGSDNSLTAAFRSMSNLLGTMAPGITGTGLMTTQQGLGTMQPAVNFYQQLLSGNPATVTQALAPTAANINNIYSGAMNQASQGMPAGGYRAATMAGLPQAQAAQVGNAALGLQPAAAMGLGQLGTTQAQIGGNLLQSGLTAQQAAVQDMLNKQQINQQVPSAFQDFLGSINALGNLASGAGGLLGGIAGLPSSTPAAPSVSTLTNLPLTSTQAIGGYGGGGYGGSSISPFGAYF